MENLIRLRSRIDELDEDEFSQFLKDSIKYEGNLRNCFVQLLFQRLKQSPVSSIPFTNIATKIINSRDSKPNDELLYDRFDHLPSAIIGECGSFLPLTDYVTFSKTNRKIYISCREPSRLYTLHLSPPALSPLDHPSIVSNVRKVAMNRFGRFYCNGHETGFDTKTFCEILSKISRVCSVEDLILNEIILTHNYSDMHDQPIFPPNLRRLCVHQCDQDLIQNIVDTVGHQLEVIHVHDSNINLQKQLLPKLRQLKMHCPTEFTQKFLVNTALLEWLSLRFLWNHKQEHLTNAVNLIFGGHLQLLNNVHLMVRSKWMPFILKQIASIIRLNKIRKSKHLSIEFDCDIEGVSGGAYDPFIYEIQTAITGLIDTLKRSTFKHFRIKIQGVYIAGKDLESSALQEWLNKLENMKQSYKVEIMHKPPVPWNGAKHAFSICNNYSYEGQYFNSDCTKYEDYCNDCYCF